jgi:hypothetical protein
MRRSSPRPLAAPDHGMTCVRLPAPRFSTVASEERRDPVSTCHTPERRIDRGSGRPGHPVPPAPGPWVCTSLHRQLPTGPASARRVGGVQPRASARRRWDRELSGLVIDYQQLVHDIPLRAAIARASSRRNNLGLPAGIPAKTLSYLGFNNSLSGFQVDPSLPVDVRFPCTHCHQDTGAPAPTRLPAATDSRASPASARTSRGKNPTARACITLPRKRRGGGARGPEHALPPSGPPVGEAARWCQRDPPPP